MHTVHYDCTNIYANHHILPQPLPLSSYFILVDLFCLPGSYQNMLQCQIKYVLQDRYLGQVTVKCLNPVTNIIINIIIKFGVLCLMP